MSEIPDRPDPEIAADLDEIVQLMARMMAGMKGSSGHREAHELVAQVRSAGLSRRHLPVLVSLALHGPSPVGVLAEHLALNPATVSQLVGELQRGGFVERRPDRRDRRRMIVSIVDRYRDVIDGFALRRLHPMRLTLEALTPEQRSHFLLGWRVLVENMERSAAAARGGPAGTQGGGAPDADEGGPEEPTLCG
jgi:DNA-binding MarR family transcriptional regulator